VILDIDETLVYFIGKNLVESSWALNEDQHSKYDVVESANGIFLVRPGCQAFLTELFKKYNVCLWTYSEKEYAMGVAKWLIRGEDATGKAKYPERVLTNIFSSIVYPNKKTGEKGDDGEDWETDIKRYGEYFNSIWVNGDDAGDLHGNNKDLNMVWWKNGKRTTKFPNMRECNTILIDDLLKNAVNPSNFRNSISIDPFAPYGEVKNRSDKYMDVSKDNVLPQCLEVLDLAQRVLTDKASRPTFNEEESVFSDSAFDIWKQRRILKVNGKLKDYSYVSVKNSYTVDRIILNKIPNHGGAATGGARKRVTKPKKATK
jgi:hypothetical protein